MSAIQVEGLWQFIQTLSLSNRNKQWLADRLIEATTQKTYANDTEYIQASPKMMEIIAKGDKQIASGKVTTTKVADLWN